MKTLAWAAPDISNVEVWRTKTELDIVADYIALGADDPRRGVEGKRCCD